MKRKIILSIFIIATIFQLIVLGSSVVRYENILSTGKVWKFEIQPVDPYDILRGRYVRLGFKKQEAKASSDLSNLQSYYRVNGFVILETNDEGFTQPKLATSEQPDETDSWIKCQLTKNYKNINTVRVNYPFDRFFMNEKLAPEADKLLRRNSDIMKNNQVYITVRLKDGIGIIENLFIDNTPISEFIRSKMGK